MTNPTPVLPGEKGDDGWPDPTMPEPPFPQLKEWESRGFSRATDGCRVEPDGTCEHGHPSWLLRLGYI